MSRIAAATSRAFPTSVWMRMYAWTTTRLLSAARARPAVKLPHRKVTTGRPGGIRWSRRGMEGAMTVATTGEFGLIARVTSRLGRESSADSRPDFGGNCLLGPGDDAAVVATPDGRAVLSTDVLVEGRHFRRDWSGARDVGHRAAAANMADIAAMGAVPTALWVALCAPADLAASWAEELADGLAAEASLVGAAVVGGDMSASGTLTIAVTALGDLGGQAPVVRSGRRPGRGAARRHLDDRRVGRPGRRPGPRGHGERRGHRPPARGVSRPGPDARCRGSARRRPVHLDPGRRGRPPAGGDVPARDGPARGLAGHRLGGRGARGDARRAAVQRWYGRMGPLQDLTTTPGRSRRPGDRCNPSAAADLAGLDAGGADLHAAGVAAAGRDAHGLDVGVPPAFGPAVGVGHVVAEARPLAADVAHAGHGILLDWSSQSCPRMTAGNRVSVPDPPRQRPTAPIAATIADGGRTKGPE